MNVKLFNMLNGNRYYPSKTYLNDSTYSLYLPRDIILEPGISKIYKLDVSINWSFDMKDFAVLSFPKVDDSLDGKVFFGSGVIDPGYTKSIYFKANNVSDETFILKQGDRILDIIFVKLYESVDMTNILKEGIR